MEARSNFYFFFFTFDCTAQLSYKLVLVFDILAGLSGLGMALSALSTLWWIMLIYLFLGLVMLYFGILSLILLINFNKNLGSGTLHTETGETLKKRIYYVYYYPIRAILQALIVFIFWIQFSTGAAFMSILINMVIQIVTWGVVGAYFQFQLQKTLHEANDVLGGTKSDLKQNQVL